MDGPQGGVPPFDQVIVSGFKPSLESEMFVTLTRIESDHLGAAYLSCLSVDNQGFWVVPKEICHKQYLRHPESLRPPSAPIPCPIGSLHCRAIRRAVMPRASFSTSSAKPGSICRPMESFIGSTSTIP